MPRHSTRPTGPQTWDHPSNEVDPRQLPLPFEGSISSSEWPEATTQTASNRLEIDLKSSVDQVHRPNPARKAARHRWEGHRCTQCGLTRNGQNGRFSGHSEYVTPDGEIMKVPGDCPGAAPVSQRKPRGDAPADAAEAERRRLAKSQMRRQINEHKRKQRGDE
jgi:hypothetical protein